MRPYLKKTHHKKGLVERLKVEALISSPSTAREREREREREKSAPWLLLCAQ
jgi:hypothetical protein